MSVVVGTLNRRDLLVRSIRCLANQTFADRFEIIVVDNGCTDGTREAVAELAKDVSNLRYVEEPTPGLSNARNRGIAEARAPLVGFMDDDGEAEPDWAEIILGIFRADPGVGAAGGRIYVRWPDAANTKPLWMPESLEGYYGRCDYGPLRKELTFPEYPFGSNMVIRRDLLQRIGGFNANLGPAGQNMMSGGELDLFRRLYTLSPKVVYDPRAVVHHWAPAERVTKEWIRKRALKHGVSESIMRRTNGGGGRVAWFGKAVQAAGHAVIGLISVAIARLSGRDPATITSRTAITAYWTGFSRSAFSIAFTRPTPSQGPVVSPPRPKERPHSDAGVTDVPQATASPSLSVVICTFNRPDLVEQCLRSLSVQAESAQPFETIVVDNGPLDCRAIVQAARRSLPNLHYIVEPRLGLSYARNRGLAAARGNIIAYLDDDATAEPGWVESIKKVWQTDWETAAAGGRIQVHWPIAKPDWMPSSLEAYFGECDYGPKRRYLEFPQYPFGSNMAFRRDVLQELGGFNEQLGARGRVMMAGEETDVFSRLARRGAKVVYEPAALVQHWPPAHRVTRTWSLERAYRHGISSAVLTRTGAKNGPRISARMVLKGTTKAFIGAVSTLLAFVTRSEASVMMSRVANSLYWAGFAVGSANPVLALSNRYPQ